jgi:hypothetical protein
MDGRMIVMTGEIHRGGTTRKAKTGITAVETVLGNTI